MSALLSAGYDESSNALLGGLRGFDLPPSLCLSSRLCALLFHLTDRFACVMGWTQAFQRRLLIMSHSSLRRHGPRLCWMACLVCEETRVPTISLNRSSLALFVLSSVVLKGEAVVQLLVGDEAYRPAFRMDDPPVYVLSRDATFNVLDETIVSFIMISIEPSFDPAQESLSLSTAGRLPTIIIRILPL